MKRKSQSSVDPQRVQITQHALDRFLIRYPSEVLPARPENEIRALLARARPMPPHRARRFRTSSSCVLAADRWVFVLARVHSPEADWRLCTVMRDQKHGNHVGEARCERPAHWRAFRVTGEAQRLLQALAEELGTSDPRALAREWARRGHPPVWHGGYSRFEDFCASALRRRPACAAAP